MSDNDLRDRLAAAMHCTLSLTLDDSRDADDALRFWRGIVDSLNHEPWRNGKHYGDCTKEAATCNRCYVEQFYQDFVDPFMAAEQREAIG